MAVAARGGAIGCSSSAPKPTTPATRLAPSPARALALVPTSWHHTTSTTSRRLVAARFVKFSLESWLPHLLPPQQHNAEQQPEEVCRYTSLLQRAEAITFGTSPCRLSDAERMLQLCIQERPRHLQPRVALLRNLMRQAREAEVPGLALEGLHEAAAAAGRNVSVTHDLHMLQLVLLALKALHKLKDQARRQASSAPQQPQQHSHSITAFLAAAQAAAPGCESEFNNLGMRVRRQLSCCSDEMRALLLADADGYLSSVDLSSVFGEHHASPAVVDSGSAA